MASPPDDGKQSIPPEKSNFIRLDLLVNDAGTKILKGFFDSKIPPEDLATNLSQKPVKNKLKKLKAKKILNVSEWEKLFPPNSSTTVESESFDLALLVKLLRQKEISGLGDPVNGWDNLPGYADVSKEADLARLRWYRNMLAHDGKREVHQNDFDNYWEDIKGALLRIVREYSQTTVTQWEKYIDNRRTTPLSSFSEMVVFLITKLKSAGVELVSGSTYILDNYVSPILEYLRSIRGVVPGEVTDGSVKIVLLITDLCALERFWDIYKSGKLKRDLEMILLTDELRSLAKDDEVELEVFVSEQEYKRTKEQLRAKEEEDLLKEFKTKTRVEEKETSQFEIFEGDIVEDGENKVQAHLAVITSKEQVEEVLAALKKKDSDVAEATHNIWAYRIFDSDRGAYDEYCDDDGDDNAGARVLRFLQRTHATDVMVVVSCWYKTTAEEFGEDRFKCIQKSILDLFLMYGIVKIPPGKIKKFYEEIKYAPLEKTRAQETPKFDILHGETIEDRKSTFQAHLADITSREQVDQVLDQLKKDRKIAKATYNMWACRIYDEKKKSYVEEGYDDGENLGGERLLHLLQRSNAKNVVIIVTRWHGGIHLGNDRFKHINKCASDLLQQRKKPEETTTASGTDPKATTSKKGKSKKEKAKKHQ